MQRAYFPNFTALFLCSLVSKNPWDTLIFFFLCKGQLDKAKALDLADRANKYKNKCKQQQLQTSIR